MYLYKHTYTYETKSESRGNIIERQALPRESESRSLGTVRSSSEVGHLFESWPQPREFCFGLVLLSCCNKRFLRQLGEIMEILLSLLLHRVTLDDRAPKRGEKRNRTTRIKGTIWIWILQKKMIWILSSTEEGGSSFCE